jgi:hypothetical protein
MRSTKNAITVARAVIWIAAFGLPAAFCWLKLHDISFATILGQVKDQIVHRMAIVLYFTSWVLGAQSDLSMQEHLIGNAKSSSKLPIAVGIAGGLLVCGFAGICSVSSPFWFSIALVGFISIDYIGWYQVMRSHIARTFEKASKSAYVDWESAAHEQDRLRHIQRIIEINAAKDLHTGNWKHARYVTGLILTGFLVVTALPIFAAWWQHLIPGIPAPVLGSLGFLVFVLVFEAWMWHKRLVTSYTISNAHVLTKAFDISPKPRR